MIASRLCRGAVFALVLAPTVALAGPLERYTLIVGANHGGGDRPSLRFAVSDARRVAQVMAELGGVPTDNEVVLEDPTVGGLLAAIDALNVRLVAARRRATAGGGRTELFFYYSGHADEKGLLLGEDRLSYRSLRDRLDQTAADVRIAVLDACASGAFTRLKGGRARPPFLVDEASGMQGHAFLTSSAETESAQESDRIRASYFTHYLVSGLRGAADLSGDGKVTLNEAYQFAFNETLGRTVDTKAGAQHPSYDINLSGAGDVVMTDVGQTTARLVLGEALEGRFFVRARAAGLIAELYKPAGRLVEIGLEPGTYEVRLDHDTTALVAKADVPEGARVILEAGRFTPTTLEPTRLRGAAGEVPRYSVSGRSRVTMQSGLWGRHGATVTVGRRGYDVFGGMQFARYIRENLAWTVGVAAYGAEAQVDIIGGVAVPVGFQWNPRRGMLAAQAFKPFLAVGAVPVSSADAGSPRRLTVGAHAGAGFDYQVAQTFAIGMEAGYNAVPRLSRPVNLHDNFNGLELTLRVGWLFGTGQSR